MISVVNLSAFPCTLCGKCCRKVYLSEQTTYLDRGDGICRHFDIDTNLCLIYENRPKICRVEDYYQENLSTQLSWDEFIQLNLEICEKL